MDSLLKVFKSLKDYEAASKEASFEIHTRWPNLMSVNMNSLMDVAGIEHNKLLTSTMMARSARILLPAAYCYHGGEDKDHLLESILNNGFVQTAKNICANPADSDYRPYFLRWSADGGYYAVRASSPDTIRLFDDLPERTPEGDLYLPLDNDQHKSYMNFQFLQLSVLKKERSINQEKLQQWYDFYDRLTEWRKRIPYEINEGYNNNDDSSLGKSVFPHMFLGVQKEVKIFLKPRMKHLQLITEDPNNNYSSLNSWEFADIICEKVFHDNTSATNTIAGIGKVVMKHGFVSNDVVKMIQAIEGKLPEITEFLDREELRKAALVSEILQITEAMREFTGAFEFLNKL